MSSEHEIAKGAAYGVISAYAMGMTQSAMHRKAHGTVEYSPAVWQTIKFAGWALAGMDNKEFEVVHLTHHAYSDQEPTQEEWAQIQADWGEVQTAYPEAPDVPVEAFRDPHSPVLEGYAKVQFLNPVLYGKAAQAILPFLRGLEAAAVPRQYWPEHLRDVDLAEDWMDRHVYSRNGMIGQLAIGGAIAAIRGPKVAAAAAATHVGLVIEAGGTVNAMGHLNTKGLVNKAKVFLGLKQPEPNADGTYTANFAEGFEGVVAGEAKHRDHHENPGNPYITSDRDPVRDPTGVIIKKLVRASLAKLPTAKPKKFQKAA